MENKSLEMFDSMPIGKSIVKNAVPAIMAMIMVVIFNLADTFFIGQTHNDVLVAAVSLATPVFLIFVALGTVFGIGGTSVISRDIGSGDTEHAKKVSSFCMWGCIVVGVVLAVLFWLCMDQLLVFIGATPDTWDAAKSYLNIVAICAPFVLISNCFSNVLRAEGQSTKAMMGMIIGNVLNIILDPIMILVFNWGIAGAAIATVIGNVMGAIYFIIYFLRGKSMLSIKLKDFTMKEKVLSGVLAIGIPAALGSLLLSVSQIIMNRLMAEYGDMAIAAAGVAMKVTLIIGMVCIGYGQGVQPILGYCVGAEKWERFRKVMRQGLLYALILGVVLTVVCFFGSGAMVSGFLTDSTALSYGVEFSHILLSSAWMFGIFFCFANALQAMGAALPALIVNISRQGIVYIPALFILKSFMGAQGLMWAQPVADVISVILGVVLYVYTFRRMVPKGAIGDAKPAK